MPITVQKLTAPRILLTGTRILENNGVITTQSVTDLDVGNLIEETTAVVNGGGSDCGRLSNPAISKDD